jgi:hypothetical protein
MFRFLRDHHQGIYIHQVIVYKTPKIVVKIYILMSRTPYSTSKM